MRTQGYQAFRTYLEITNFCANSHEHAAQWANQLEDWHGRASLTGNDRKWVDDSIVSLRAAAKGEKDLQAAVTDFLVREILRSNIAGNDLGGPISDITKEMRRMIIVCGW
jgi:hypothetical protein